MLKPLLGAAAVLIVLVGLLAGNLNTNYAQKSAAEEVQQVAKVAEQPRRKQPFSRQAPDPVEQDNDPFSDDDEIYYDADDNTVDPFAVPQGDDDNLFAASPFVDPNSGFAGQEIKRESERPAAKNTEQAGPPRADGVIRPGPLRKSDEPIKRRTVRDDITEDDLAPL